MGDCVGVGQRGVRPRLVMVLRLRLGLLSLPFALLQGCKGAAHANVSAAPRDFFPG